MAAPKQFQLGVQRLANMLGLSFFLVDNGSPQFTSAKIKGGTFVANGAATVIVADTDVDAGSNILISLNAPGGTVGAIPSVKTITAGTGFTVSGTASDTSTYNYLIIG